MKTFSELTLSPSLEKALAAMNFTIPTPVQAQAIPVAMQGRDVIACAQTGTGKTVAFAIPMLSELLKSKDKTALILVPTRELAVQVTEVLRQLTLHMPTMRVVNLIGGMSMQPQLRALQKGCRVIVATPGRLLDHLDRRTANISKIAVLTLDEADRMLDMGFAPQLREIFKYLPNEYQTLLFSATLPPNIIELTKNILENPAQVKIGEVSTAAPLIEQKMLEVKGEKKNDTVLDQINARKGSILIFARTQARTDRLCKYLEKYNVSVGRIHGGRSQGQRNRALEDFRSEAVRVLVATDIAARGIDIDHVAHVINFDLPQVAEDYIHRIGRTGRAGRSGEAISLVAPEERVLWREIQKLLAKKTGAKDAGPVKSFVSSATPQARVETQALRPSGAKPAFGPAASSAKTKIPQPFFRERT